MTNWNFWNFLVSLFSFLQFSVWKFSVLEFCFTENTWIPLYHGSLYWILQSSIALLWSIEGLANLSKLGYKSYQPQENIYSGKWFIAQWATNWFRYTFAGCLSNLCHLYDCDFIFSCGALVQFNVYTIFIHSLRFFAGSETPGDSSWSIKIKSYSSGIKLLSV